MNRLLFAIQVYENLDPASEAELVPRFSWSAKRMYGLNAPGQNHGLLMGTQGWVPYATVDGLLALTGHYRSFSS
jgi:hypothetical protein